MASIDVTKLVPAERIKKLLTSAENHKVNSLIPLLRYYRSMLEIHKMGISYLEEGNLEKALVLMYRFAWFAMRELPKHKDYTTLVCDERSQIGPLIGPAMDTVERIKGELKQLFDKEAEEIKKVLEAQGRQEENDETRSITSGQSETRNEPSTSEAKVEHPNAPITLRTTGEDYFSDANVTVAIASDLVAKFLELTADNTANNVETCAVLCGKISRDHRYLITHAILPKQTGTSDGCIAEGELEMFTTQDELNLVTLGWIHTHPTQTAFLSSVDLHTHYSYQSLHPASIAIVCAPTYKQVGTFSLTEQGLSVIAQCTSSGFHLHEPSTDLYIECPHVIYTTAVSGTMIDLRGST